MFLWRQIVDPFLLFLFLAKEKPSFILLNDFEQSSAFLWVPLFKLFLKKHIFSVFLHDPDRDHYPPNYNFSVWSMKKMMSLMNVALYHEYLPAKPYYTKPRNLIYLKVPHGIYPPAPANPDLLEKLNNIKYQETNSIYSGIDQFSGSPPDSYRNHRVIISIIGNIRPEKNYELAIKSLKCLPGVQLLIAGNPANSSIDTKHLKSLAGELKLANRMVWLEKFLSEAEFSAVIQASDVVLLYYTRSFKSQSGILNSIAPYEKQFVFADHPSSLSSVAKEYQIGIACESDNQAALQVAIDKAINSPVNHDGWKKYKEENTWQKQVDLVMQTLSSNRIK